jgi:hypothetical protein
MEAQLQDVFLRLARAQASASSEVTGGQEENRPVLHARGVLLPDLAAQSFLDLFLRIGTAEEASYLRVRPEHARQRQVMPGPEAEADSLATEKMGMVGLAH